MTEAELKNLLHQPESEAIECKSSMPDRQRIAEYAVGIGNAGGGWFIVGVTDKRPRRVTSADLPSEGEIARTRESVAGACGIHLAFEVVDTREGAVLVCRIPPRPRGIPLHTSDGKYLIRLGEGLRGMTLQEMDAVRREAGSELTAVVLAEPPGTLLSPSGMEELRRLMTEAGAAPDLIRQGDNDLLQSLGVVDSGGQLKMAGLLLAGRPEAIRKHLPFAGWQFRRMKADTDYDQAEDGHECLPLALKRLRDLVNANNPIVTVPGLLVHPEFPRYPSLALRELLVNALAHRDYEAPGAVTLKLYPSRLELSNPGGFVGGVTPANILHHPSSPRYPTIFAALAKMRLANAANLGVPRVYRDLLVEGKEPPDFWTSGQAVRVTVKGQEARREFVELVQRHQGLDVDHLLLLHNLTRHREITVRTAAGICQRPKDSVRELLSQLISEWGLLETGGGPGAGRYYRLSRAGYKALIGTLTYHVDRQLTQENAKARVLAALADRPLTNADVREITQLSRFQCVRLMQTLRSEGSVDVEGERRWARWRLRKRS